MTDMNAVPNTNTDFIPAVLFVDDEKSVLSALRRLCRPLKYEVHIAESGKQGLELLAQHSIDLVVSDMRMPEMSGAEFLEQVAASFPETKRILLTGYSDIDSTIAAINKGKIDSYVSKPWDNEAMRASMERVLYTKKLEDERRQLRELTAKQNKELAALNSSLEKKVEERTQSLNETVLKLDKANSRLTHTYDISVQAFGNLISLRNESDAGHSNRVAEYAELTAKKLNLPEESQRQIRFAALLHDIGEIGLRDEILAKPYEKMTQEERKPYQEHPALGEAVLMGIDALQESAVYVRSHHERFDGTGFPDQLEGEAIPLGSRIIAIASDFDSFVSGSMTGTSLTIELAKENLESQAGKRYDGNLLALFFEVVEEVIDQHVSEERLLDSSELEEGMTLSRDLITPTGILLLSKGYELDPELIKRIRKFEADQQAPFSVYVIGADR